MSYSVIAKVTLSSKIDGKKERRLKSYETLEKCQKYN